MALPQLIENAEWVFKVTRELSKHPVRDVCLLGFFVASPCTTLELNRIQLGDVVGKSGKLNKKFMIRGDAPREFYLTNKKLIKMLNEYIEVRVKNKACLGNHPDHYLGLDPDDALFISYQGEGFSITKRKTAKGNISYACDALNRHLKMLLSHSGIEKPSVLSGRRTFAVSLARKGIDVAHIHYLLGNKSLKTTQKMIATDPANMGAIAAEAF